MSRKGAGGKKREKGGRVRADPDPAYTWSCSWNTLQSNKDGFFRRIFEGVEDSMSKSQLSAFGQLDSDLRRVQYLQGLEVVQQVTPVEMFRKKDAQEAYQLMAQAESLLQKGSSGQALNLLSRAITKAPGEALVSGLLGVRSRALSNLGQHQLALRDTQTALATRVADPCARAHLLRTQGRCYLALQDAVRAKLAYVSAQRLLDPNNAEFKQLRAELQLEIEQCQYTNPNSQPEDTTKIAAPELTGGRNASIPHTSLLVGVRETPETGRYIVAKSKIDSGDVLAVEPAYCSVLLMDKAGTHCHHCFARLVAPVGCPECSGVAFCGRECQEAACKSYHKAECKYLNLFIGLGMSVLCHLALRIVTRTGSACRFLELSKAARSSNPAPPSEQVSAKDVDEYKRFLQLVGHAGQRTSKDYLSRTLMACFLTRCLRQSGAFWPSDTVSREEEAAVAEALLTHLCILQFNTHEVFETLARTRTKIKGTKTQYIGVAVYLSVALFNHDCNPAVARCFQGTTMLLHALRPVQPGEMVGENYGPMFSKQTLGQRQRALRSRYWFDCACQACAEKWNTFDQGIKSTDKAENVQKMFDLGFEAMEDGKLEGAIYLLSQFINSIDGLVLLPDREMCLAIDALRLCLMSHWGTVVVVQAPKSVQSDTNAHLLGIESSVEITELTEEDE